MCDFKKSAIVRQVSRNFLLHFVTIQYLLNIRYVREIAWIKFWCFEWRGRFDVN